MLPSLNAISSVGASCNLISNFQICQDTADNADNTISLIFSLSSDTMTLTIAFYHFDVE
jgi:hypothetical protein